MSQCPMAGEGMRTSPGKGPAGSGEALSPTLLAGGRRQLQHLNPSPGASAGKGAADGAGCAMPSTSVLSACKPPLPSSGGALSQGHAGGCRAPACWSPTALRPQGHSHGLQLSLPLPSPCCPGPLSGVTPCRQWGRRSWRCVHRRGDAQVPS